MDAPTKHEKSKPNDYRLQLKFAFQSVPLAALDEKLRLILSEALNKSTVTVSSKHVMRNFKGLAELIGFQYSEIQTAANTEDPTGYLLTQWSSQSGDSIGRLLEHLNRMERYDVLDDLYPILTENSSIRFMPFMTALEVENEETLQMRDHARSFGLNFFTRADWGAYCPRQKSLMVVKRVKVIFIHHTVWYDSDPIRGLQIMQARKVIHYGHNDVPYSFIISEDGRVFEGRGWDLGGSHTLRYNYVTLSFALFGNFEDHRVPQAITDSLQKLFDYGVAIGKIDPDYGIYPHCDASETLSPGKYALEVISKFPKYHAFGDLPTSDSLLPEAAKE